MGRRSGPLGTFLGFILPKFPPRVGIVSESLGFGKLLWFPDGKGQESTCRVLGSSRCGPPELRLAREGGGVGIAEGEGRWGEGGICDSPGSAAHWL